MIRTVEMYSVYVSVKANIVNAFAGTVWSRHATPSLSLAGKRVRALRDKTKQWLNRRLKLQGITQNHTRSHTPVECVFPSEFVELLVPCDLECSRR